MKLIAQPLPDNLGELIIIDSENLDAGNVARFKEMIQPHLAAPKLLILDLSRLDFVDSSGMGAMLSCLRTLQGRDGRLKLVGMGRRVQALFELLRMHRIFPIHATCADALASL